MGGVHFPETLLSLADSVREEVILGHGVGVEDLALAVDGGAVGDVWNVHFVVVTLVDVRVEAGHHQVGEVMVCHHTHLEQASDGPRVPVVGQVACGSSRLVELARNLLPAVVRDRRLAGVVGPDSLVLKRVFNVGEDDVDGS